MSRRIRKDIFDSAACMDGDRCPACQGLRQSVLTTAGSEQNFDVTCEGCGFAYEEVWVMKRVVAVRVFRPPL